MRSMRELMLEIDKNPEFRANIAQNPIRALRDFSELSMRSPLDTDNLVYRMVVGALGAIGLAAIFGCILLGFTERSSSEVITGIIALGSAAVGALAGLLAPHPKP